MEASKKFRTQARSIQTLRNNGGTYLGLWGIWNAAAGVLLRRGGGGSVWFKKHAPNMLLTPSKEEGTSWRYRGWIWGPVSSNQATTLKRSSRKGEKSREQVDVLIPRGSAGTNCETRERELNTRSKGKDDITGD